jgi:hypothetical protein
MRHDNHAIKKNAGFSRVFLWDQFLSVLQRLGEVDGLNRVTACQIREALLEFGHLGGRTGAGMNIVGHGLDVQQPVKSF